MNFDELLRRGNESADEYQSNLDEIEKTLDELSQSLSKFLACDLEVYKSIDYVENVKTGLASLTDPFAPKEKTGFTNIHVRNVPTGETLKLFKLKYSSDVYPLTLSFDDKHYVAPCFPDFQGNLGEVISSTDFHLRLRHLKNRILKEEEKKKLKLGDSSTED